MQGRQVRHLRDCCFVQGEASNQVLLPLQWQIDLRRGRQGQFAQMILDTCFPNRYDAQIDLVGRVTKNGLPLRN